MPPHNFDKALDRRRVLDRSAAELHYHYLIILFESAGLLCFARLIATHCFHSIAAKFWPKKNPPPDRFWRWVRVNLLRLLYFIRSRPPEDT